ncbi:MAG TPA: hypothetical protein P5301_01090 [Bacteroidales bacterium]|nr:hypothetical protein [Bacteroidales bacterium]HRR52049.1 hypothetical protein [Bacteroidales bacterium]
MNNNILIINKAYEALIRNWDGIVLKYFYALEDDFIDVIFISKINNNFCLEGNVSITSPLDNENSMIISSKVSILKNNEEFVSFSLMKTSYLDIDKILNDINISINTLFNIVKSYLEEINGL